jgi:transposase
MSYRIAGIDVHKKMLAVAISDIEGAGEFQFQRRKFLATPEPLRRLSEWLVEQEVEEVVMESTAQYWQPVWGALEEYWQPTRRNRPGAGKQAGELHLAQAQSNKAPRGRKNDFRDAERLVKRLVAQELILSFVPDTEQRLWRTITRRRVQLLRDKVRVQNQLESVLEQAHVKLSSLVSDLLGVSARRMLKALADGESDPAVLAAMAESNLQATAAQLYDALSPCRTLQPIYRDLVKMMLEQLQLIETQVEQLEQKAALLMGADQNAVERLAEIPGMGVISALQTIAEVGPRAARFNSAGELCSWVGVIPGEQVSAEENASSHSPKGNRPMRRILSEAAHAAVKTNGSIFEVKLKVFCRRMKYQAAVWAVAHFLCELIWKVLHEGIRYEERGPGVNAKAKHKRTKRLIRELKALGYRVEAPVQAKPCPA